MMKYSVRSEMPHILFCFIFSMVGKYWCKRNADLWLKKFKFSLWHCLSLDHSLFFLKDSEWAIWSICSGTWYFYYSGLLSSSPRKNCAWGLPNPYQMWNTNPQILSPATQPFVKECPQCSQPGPSPPSMHAPLSLQ